MDSATHGSEEAVATSATPASRSARWGVPVLGFATFAVGTDEFVLAGVLPGLSDNLHVSVATAGQVVTVFAVTCAVLAPVLATLTAARSRRIVLLLAISVYILGNIGTALAPSFGSVLGAQIVAAAGAGLFVPTAAVTAAAMICAPRTDPKPGASAVPMFPRM